MTSGSFDENDFDSLYFPGVNFDDARNILAGEDEGVFLIRDSSRGGHVICVREKDDVSQMTIVTKNCSGETTYFIREDCPFKNLPALLSFYKRNKFHTTQLKRPVSRERVILRSTGNSFQGADRRQTFDTPHSSLHPHGTPNKMRQSAPDMSRYARVVKPRDPSPYYTNWLTLKVDDEIRIIKIKDGVGVGELNGEIGEFPLINVEILHKT